MITWLGGLKFRHNDPTFIDRVEAALRENRLPNEYIPEPTTFKGALWGIDSGQERLRYDWRLAHWGCWAMSIEAVERVDSFAVRARFEAASYTPIAVMARMIDLGYSIEGTWVDDTHTFAERYDNGVTTEDPDGSTVLNWDGDAYLEECALRGETPVLDERGKPDRSAVCAYFGTLHPQPAVTPAVTDALTYFEALAAKAA